MSFMLTRMFAYLTLVAYLLVGTVAVRILAPEMTTVSFSNSYLKVFSNTSLQTSEIENLVAPEMTFAEIKFPVAKKIVVVAKPAAPKNLRATLVDENTTSELSSVKLAKNELPFHEPVTLEAVRTNVELIKVAALYKEFQFERVAASDLIEDSVTTAQASTFEEPEFFEYPVAETKETKKTEPSTENLTAEVINGLHNVESVEAVEAVDNSLEEVVIDDIVAFDYSKANQDVKAATKPTESKMTTQVSGVVSGSANLTQNNADVKIGDLWGKSSTSKTVPVVSSHSNTIKNVGKQAGIVNKDIKETTQKEVSQVTIQITGTDLFKTQEEVNFEVRYQDDLSEAAQDYGTGYVSMDANLQNPSMTRSLTVLKRGFAPTNTDLIVEPNLAASIPMIEENKFRELLAPFEARGAIGAVLVELSDGVHGATLDVPYSQVLQLNADMQVTSEDDFVYQLFVGAKAGNALLSFKDDRGVVTSKVIHIHEHELTFEGSYFEEVTSEKVELLEEDLLSREKTPLIISSEEVKEFATNKTTTKINDRTHSTSFGKILRGTRKYLELGHQSEPVFVGFKNASSISVPSEAFMRYILSRFEGGNLGNRCLIQLNLTKTAAKVDVASESVSESIMTSTQVLDKDGKFYDSVGPKTQKVIVAGENHGGPEYSKDGKINFKVTYEDGSVEFLGSYCSPNTYLVEQL